MKNSTHEKTTITCEWSTRRVWIGPKELLPGASQKVCNHSPDGFNWGYEGSGSAQLALALLLDLTHDEPFSVAHYQAFKWAIVAGFPQADFEYSLTRVQEWIARKRDENADPS